MKLRTRDVAICADTSPYVVREYIDAGLLGPMYRSENNYRWIDLLAVPQVYLWRTLQEVGYTMEQLRAFGESRTPEKALEMLQECGGRLETQISKLQARQDTLRSFISLTRENQSVQSGEIGVRALPARPIDRVPLGRAGGGVNEYERLRGCFAQVRNSGCPMGYAWSAFDDLLERPDQPAQLVSFNPKGAGRRPAGEYLIGTAACGNGEAAGLPRRMLGYALQNSLEFRGPAYAVYLHDAAGSSEQGQYLLQIAVGVNRA